MQLERRRKSFFCSDRVRLPLFCFAISVKLSTRMPTNASIMKKENHSALVAAYGLTTYPTLLIVGPNGLELDNIVGGAAIRDCIEERLIQIYRENNA